MHAHVARCIYTLCMHTIPCMRRGYDRGPACAPWRALMLTIVRMTAQSAGFIAASARTMTMTTTTRLLLLLLGACRRCLGPSSPRPCAARSTLAGLAAERVPARPQAEAACATRHLRLRLRHARAQARAAAGQLGGSGGRIPGRSSLQRQRLRLAHKHLQGGARQGARAHSRRDCTAGGIAQQGSNTMQAIPSAHACMLGQQARH